MVVVHPLGSPKKTFKPATVARNPAFDQVLKARQGQRPADAIRRNALKYAGVQAPERERTVDYLAETFLPRTLPAQPPPTLPAQTRHRPGWKFPQARPPEQFRHLHTLDPRSDVFQPWVEPALPRDQPPPGRPFGPEKCGCFGAEFGPTSFFVIDPPRCPADVRAAHGAEQKTWRGKLVVASPRMTHSSAAHRQDRWAILAGDPVKRGVRFDQRSVPRSLREKYGEPAPVGNVGRPPVSARELADRGEDHGQDPAYAATLRGGYVPYLTPEPKQPMSARGPAPVRPAPQAPLSAR